jgi:hypothetical protein
MATPSTHHRTGALRKSPKEITMASLILTALPFVLTFSVAAWHAPSKEIQPRSGEPGQSNCKR